MICEPMCICTPRIAIFGIARRVRKLRRPVERDAEFVFAPAGGNIMMSFGIDIGIDAQGNRRADTFFAAMRSM